MVGQNFRNGGVKTYKGMVNCSVLGSITEIRAEGVKIFTFIIKKFKKGLKIFRKNMVGSDFSDLLGGSYPPTPSHMPTYD